MLCQEDEGGEILEWTYAQGCIGITIISMCTRRMLLKGKVHNSLAEAMQFSPRRSENRETFSIHVFRPGHLREQLFELVTNDDNPKKMSDWKGYSPCVSNIFGRYWRLILRQVAPDPSFSGIPGVISIQGIMRGT
jgi:hypothetical protein